MKSTMTCFLASAAILAASSRGDEVGKVHDYDLVPIGSLDEIQGRWTSEPAGALRYRGNILEIDGQKGSYSIMTDTPPMRHDPVEVGLEIAGGAAAKNRRHPSHSQKMAPSEARKTRVPRGNVQDQRRCPAPPKDGSALPSA